MPLVKSIVELLLAVCVEIKFKEPPYIAVGKAVIADSELLLAKFTDIRILHTVLWFLHLCFPKPF